jgi:hypothetical protein
MYKLVQQVPSKFKETEKPDKDQGSNKFKYKMCATMSHTSTLKESTDKSIKFTNKVNQFRT